MGDHRRPDGGFAKSGLRLSLMPFCLQGVRQRVLVSICKAWPKELLPLSKGTGHSPQ